jgi:hypothetical protein
MSRTNLKIDRETKRTLDDVKRQNETWDECLRRLAQLDRATRTPADGDRVFRELVADEAPEWAGDAVIGAKCDECGHVSETVAVDHGTNRGDGVGVCERCGGPVTKTLIDVGGGADD